MTVRLLDPDVLKGPKFYEFEKWRRILGAEPGWHYPIDLTWILGWVTQNLDPPATVLDVGAGTGLLQFLLAAQGYKVISLDLVSRRIGQQYKRYFLVRDKQTKTLQTEYARHLTDDSSRLRLRIHELLRLAKRRFSRAIRPLTLESRKAYKHRSEYGPIELYVGDITDSWEEYSTVDGIVSLSALEHVPSIEHFVEVVGCLREFGKPMCITTSAARETTWWHEPSKGWCFGPEVLGALDGSIENSSWRSSYDATLGRIRTSSYLKNNIPWYYFGNPNCGLPNGLWEPRYVPVALTACLRTEQRRDD